MRPVATSLAAAPFLAACTLLDGPLALGEIGLTQDDVLAGERETLRTAHSHGKRMETAEISAVKNLNCSRYPYGRTTPSCRYRLLFRKQDGTDGELKRRNQYFSRDDTGHWEPAIIVRTD